MNDQSIARKVAPLSITQFNVHAEGANVRLKISMHNMHEWPKAVSLMEGMRPLGWEIDHERSRGGSILEVVISDQTVSTVVDRLHGLNVNVLRPLVG